jgi:hypothetical protein
MSRQQWHAAVCIVAMILFPACSDHEDGLLSPEESQPYNPEIPTSWASSVTNPYSPLVPGTIFEYRGETDEGTETNSVEVLSATKVIQGVTATIVWDRVFLEGSLIEETFDWYAQDSDGNVWYLGEDSKEYEDGEVVSTEGSWEWGIDGALPGIIMWADPGSRVNKKYRQEYYAGVAEDWAKVIGVDADVQVPYDDFEDCLQTEDWSGLDPGHRENKFYAPGVGLVLEVPKEDDHRLELINVTP